MMMIKAQQKGVDFTDLLPFTKRLLVKIATAHKLQQVLFIQC